MAAEDDESALLVGDARRQIARKDYAAAAAALDRALLDDPRRIDAYLLRAGVHAVANQYPQGIALMRRALILAPDNVEVLAALGAQLVLGGFTDEAVPLLERVVKAQKDSYQAHAMLGHYYTVHDRPDDAARELAAYLATRPVELAREDVAFERALGDVELRGGHAAQARRRFDALVVRDKGDELARLGQAWAAAALDCAVAAPLLDALLPLADRHPEILLVAGRCQLVLGHAASASGLADRFLAVRPSAGGHALRGEVLVAAGKPDEGVRELRAAASLAPHDAVYSVRLARALRRSGDLASARDALRVAAGQGGIEPEYSIELGKELLEAGDAPAAAVLLGPIVARFPEAAAAHRVLGGAALAAGTLDLALFELDRSFALGTDDQSTRPLLAAALLRAALGDRKAGALELAESRLARAATLAPDDVVILTDLGVVRLLRNDSAGALAPLERASRSDTGGHALAAYGRALSLEGRTVQALAAFRAALALLTYDARRADVVVDLAATELATGAPARALEALETELARTRTRGALMDAYVVAAQATAVQAMERDDGASALRVLLKAERLATGADSTALRCLVALVATATGERELALARLRVLVAARARCPFTPPADSLALAFLVAANAEPGKAEEALGTLSTSRRAAVGAMETLATEITRTLEVRAAAEAHARGNSEGARHHLAAARKLRGAAAQELVYDQALLDLDAGHVDAAIAALDTVAGDLPEAQIALGLAWDRKGDPVRALLAFERARAQGSRMEELAAWIASKRRIHGEAP